MPESRFDFPAELLRRPRLRRFVRLLEGLLTLGFFGFALIFLALRYLVLPHIGD